MAASLAVASDVRNGVATVPYRLGAMLGTMVDSLSQYLTLEQAASLLPFGNADWIRQQLRVGRLRGSKVGGRWLVEEAAIDEMVKAGANTEAPRRRRRRRIVE